MVTLNDIKVGRADKVDQLVIDQFIRKSALLAALPFDDCISPNGGSTLTYGYIRLATSPAAEGREINNEYTASESTREKITTDLKILGGSYKIDRVLGKASPNEVAFQTEEKVKATVNRFHYLFINGDKNNATEFDGLKKVVNGSSTDFDGSAIDLSTMNASNAIVITEALDAAILNMSEKPQFIIANYKGIVKLKSAARTLGYLTQVEDAFGKPVESYNGIQFLDLGRYYNAKLGKDCDIVGIDDASGRTDIYLVSLGQGGVHGVTIDGDKAISQRLPDFSTAGSVKEGDVEFVAGLAVKNTRAIARIKNVKVQAALTTLGTLSFTVNTNKIVVDPSLPKIGNAYYYAVASSTIAALSAGTAINTTTYAKLPVNGVVELSANDFARVVEVDAVSLLPIAQGEVQFV